MSGGSFDYSYYHFQAFAEQLRLKLSGDDPDEDCPEMTLDEEITLLLFANKLEEIADAAKAIEWWFSGDSGSRTTMALLKKLNL